jgi:hypothetical protein
MAATKALKSCATCAHFREPERRCWDLGIAVRPDDVCDGWKANPERVALLKIARAARRNAGLPEEDASHE